MLAVSLQHHLPLAMVALAVGAAVSADAVPLSRRTLLAAAPWTVAASCAVVAARAGVYDGMGLPITVPRLLAAVGIVAVGCWLLFVQVAVLRDVDARDRYLAATGLGAAVVVLVALLVHLGGAEPPRAIWLAIAPVLAGLFAAAGYFTLGLVYTDPIVQFRLAGLYAIATVVFDGIASAAALEVLGYDEFGLVTAGIVAAVDAAGITLSTWLLLPIHVLVGVVSIAVCGWLTRRRDWLGTGLALAVSVLALGSATVVLLSAVLLG